MKVSVVKMNCMGFLLFETNQTRQEWLIIDQTLVVNFLR